MSEEEPEPHTLPQVFIEECVCSDGCTRALALSSDGSTLCAGSSDGRVRWLAPEAEGAPAEAPCSRLAATAGEVRECGGVISLLLVADGSLYSGHADGRLCAWSSSQAPRWEMSGSPCAVHPLLLLGDRLCSAAGPEVNCWPLGEPEPDRLRLTAAADVTCLAALHERVLVVATRDGRVAAFDGATLGELVELTPANETAGEGPMVLSLTTDGPATLVAGCCDGALRVWEAPAELFKAAGGPVHPPARVLRGSHGASAVGVLVCARPGAARCFSGAEDGSVSGWQHNAALGGEVAMASPGRSACTALCLDGEAALLFGAAADGSLRCWRTVDGSLLALQPRAHSGRVEALALRPGPAALYAGSLDGTVRAWALAAAPEEGAADRGCEAGLTAAYSAIIPSAALRQSLRDEVAELEVAASAGAEALRDSLWAAAAEAEAWGSAAVAAAAAAAAERRASHDPGPALTVEPDGYGSYAHIREDAPPPIRAQWPPPARPEEAPPPVLAESIVESLSAATTTAVAYLSSPGSPSRTNPPAALLRSLAVDETRSLLGSPSSDALQSL